MKLFELVGVKKFFDLPLDELILQFVEHGKYKKLGKGFFAYVFKNPKKNEVVKFWANDNAYEDWIDYVEKHQSNSYFPKLHSKVKTISTFHKRVAGFPDKIKYIRMETLEPVNATMRQKIDDVDWDLAVANEMHERGSSIDDTQMKELSEIARLVGEALDSIGRNWSDLDIGSNNIMMRGSQLVITDPLSDEDSISVMDELIDLDQAMKTGKLPSTKGRSGAKRG